MSMKQNSYTVLARAIGWALLSAIPCSARGQMLLQFDRPARQADSAGGLEMYTADGVSISADGRYVAFASSSKTLVAGIADANRVTDVFLYDRLSGSVELVSRSATSAATANARSYSPRLSADGRYVLYLSMAGDICICSGFTGKPGAILFDRMSGQNRLVSHAASPTISGNGYTESAEISADGSTVVFMSTSTNIGGGITDSNGTQRDIFLYDVASEAISLVSRGMTASATANSASEYPVVSANGGFVAFQSSATNVGGLSIGNLNYFRNVFVHDRVAASWRLLSAKAGAPSTSPNDSSQYPRISGDGGWVVFESYATDLLSAVTDSNNWTDVYLASTDGASMILVSHRSGQARATGDGGSQRPSLSDDGQYVGYVSAATNLVAGQADGNGGDDAFLFTRASGLNSLVSHGATNTATGNSQAASVRMSADGNWALLAGMATDYGSGFSDANSGDDIYLYQRSSQSLTLVTRAGSSSVTTANSYSDCGAMSAVANWIAFCSTASNIVPGIFDEGQTADAFLYETATGSVRLASPRDPATSRQAAGGGLEIGLTAVDDAGRYVVFASASRALVSGVIDDNVGSDIYLYDRGSRTNRLVSHRIGDSMRTCSGPWTGSSSPSISRDGRYVVFASSCVDLVAGQTDGNSSYDIFLYDITADANTLVSHASGAPLSTGNYSSYLTWISADGRYVAYRSYASNLAGGVSDGNNNSDVYLFDRTTGLNRLVSHAASAMTAAAGASGYRIAMNSDARYIAFNSLAADVGGAHIDTNGGWDVFLFDASDGSIRLVSHAAGSPNTAANDSTYDVWLADQGGALVVTSLATNLMAGVTDGAGTSDLFFYQTAPNAFSLISHSPYSLSTAAGINSSSLHVTLSADGAFAAFSSSTPYNANDANGFSDVYLYTATTGGDRIVSLAADGYHSANYWSSQPVISRDGTRVLFHSAASNILPGVTPVNGATLVYQYNVGDSTLSLLSGANEGVAAAPDGSVSLDGASSDGRYALFSSDASNLQGGGLAPDGGLFLRLPCSGAPSAPITNLRAGKAGAGILWQWGDVGLAENYQLYGDYLPSGGFLASEGVASSGATGMLIDPAPARPFHLLVAENACGAGPLR